MYSQRLNNISHFYVEDLHISYFTRLKINGICDVLMMGHTFITLQGQTEILKKIICKHGNCFSLNFMYRQVKPC